MSIRREQIEAERLYEAIGGDLCICQRPEVSHWCESCQRRIQLILEKLAEVRHESATAFVGGSEGRSRMTDEIAAIRAWLQDDLEGTKLLDPVLTRLAQAEQALKDVKEAATYHATFGRSAAFYEIVKIVDAALGGQQP